MEVSFNIKFRINCYPFMIEITLFLIDDKKLVVFLIVKGKIFTIYEIFKLSSKLSFYS